MIPTRRLVALATVPTALAVGAVLQPGLLVPVIALDVVLLLIGVLDALLARGDVRATRKVPVVHAVGKPFEVAVTLSNVGRRALSLRVTDDAPGTADGLPAVVELRPGLKATVTYEARVPRRGEHRFGPVTVRWRSPLGLWERQRELEAPDSIRIYPDFAQLRSYGLQARADEQRLPVRARRRPGGETEFERLRPYIPGDPYRHIDWRATARRGNLISREFGQEVNQNLILMLDCGRMMSAGNGELTSFDHALNAALMMGQVALRHGDRVGLLAFDREIRAWLPPKGGARAGSRLIRGTYDVFPTLHEPDYALAFRHLSQRVRRRSLVVVFTSVVDEVNAQLSEVLVKGLVGRHLPVCVWVRDTDLHGLVDARAQVVADQYVRCAAAEMVGWRERTLSRLRSRGALVVDSSPDQLTPELLGRYLEIKARRLL